MRGKLLTRLVVLSVLAVVLLLLSMSVFAQESGPTGQVETGVSEEASSSEALLIPEVEVVAWQKDMPALTVEQEEQIEINLDRMNLPGPAQPESLAEVEAAFVEALPAGSESVQASAFSPQAPGDAQLYRVKAPVTTSGAKSNVMEASVAQSGKYGFYTGNWFAARTTDGGNNWSYVNPYSGMNDFCCDQVTIHDESRDVLLWYRQGVADANGVNRIKLGASIDNGATFCNYNIYPTNVNSGWTNQWFDYPQIALGADYLYIATNLFDANDNWQRTVLIRTSLDTLRACQPLSFSYYASTSWFTFVPVQGADHIMYFASNWPSTSPQNNRIAVWKWAEDSNVLSSWVKNVAAWNFTIKGQAVCGSANGNWAARTDQRLLTGARYMIHGTNLKAPGRKVVGWWWNVKQGGNFPLPYIDAAAFYEDTMAQAAGGQGRPYVQNASTCFLYPSFAPNRRGDLGGVFNYSTDDNKRPAVAFTIADDYRTAPPGFTYYNVISSNARPSDNKWGDYNISRPFLPTQNTWVGGGHYIANTSNCSSCGQPVFFNFGRGRDYQSWNIWKSK